MTAATRQKVNVPPRFVIRIFWLIHRMIYRWSGGRIGLTRPVIGRRFGMMRLETIGRRSGERRPVILGYFEDGPNIVTLAMNGWADTDPAWWLNLQARPETEVVLSGGRRSVRARTAAGDERERLWAQFGDYPGWGDIDALAERRSIETQVVVLEPASRAVRETGRHTEDVRTTPPTTTYERKNQR